jgi:hypothetical protein
LSNIETNRSRIKNVPRRGYYGVGVLIVLLVVGHFAAQLTFITNENWPVDASSVAAVPSGGPTLAVLPAAPDEMTSNTGTRDLGDLILNQYHFGEKDADAKDGVDQKESPDRQFTIVRAKQSSKEKARNEARTARLRRAEKMLTGF